MKSSKAKTYYAAKLSKPLKEFLHTWYIIPLHCDRQFHERKVSKHSIKIWWTLTYTETIDISTYIKAEVGFRADLEMHEAPNGLHDQSIAYEAVR